MTSKYVRERLARNFKKSHNLDEKHKDVKKPKRDLHPKAPINRDIFGTLSLSFEGIENSFRCPFDKQLCDSNHLLYGEDL